MDRKNEYVPVRLGEPNAQTRWVLERAGLDEPRLLPHILLRVRDVMNERFERADGERPVREVGLTMAQKGLDVLPIVDGGGKLAGIMTERVLARRYIRESREASSLVDAPTRIGAIRAALDGIKDVHYGAAIVVDQDCPCGIVDRTNLVRPEPRRVILVDHAEQAQSVHGIDEAEIIEILDHHHIGSIETRVPVRATFDPVGSTATLVVERFRQNGMEPTEPAATCLLGAVLSDTVILNSPTTTDRDRVVVEYLENRIDVDATKFGREMFEAGSDVSEATADEIVTRDSKEYEVGGDTISIAQVETVGRVLDERRDELMDALERVRDRHDHTVSALMVTDILEGDTTLLVVGDKGPVHRAFDADGEDGVVDLPGVISRKKQVAPVVLGAF
jgi:inorganic pyrophosphatase/exopolyphosphatase